MFLELIQGHLATFDLFEHSSKNFRSFVCKIN